MARLFYPERRAGEESGLDRFFRHSLRRLLKPWQTRLSRLKNLAARVSQRGEELKGLSEARLREETEFLRHSLRPRGLVPELVVRSFALTREWAHRRLGMRPFEVQVLGGWWCCAAW